jgi:murein DD-endopeptidase MepM/ murein hydrolase activator NlpD
MAPVLVLVAVLGGSVQDSIYDQVKGKSGQLNGVNAQIQQAKGELNGLLAQDTALKRQIANLDAQLGQVAAQIRQETARLELLRVQLDAAKVELAAKEAELARHIAEFGKRMRLMYKTGEVSPLELILSAGNFSDLLNRIFFFNDIVKDDRRQVEALRQERADVQAMKAALDAKHAEQAQIVASVKDQQAQLKATRVQRAAQEQQMITLEARVQAALQEEQAQRAALQAQLQQLIQESIRAHSTGHFDWPMRGDITQGFGCTSYVFENYDPGCASRHFHTGIDIATDFGTPVHAADSGIVHNLNMVCSFGLCGFGHYVVMVHAAGYLSLYGHLSNWAVADGTAVGQGSVIGYEGSTGNSTGAHLHFEIDLNGTPVNPLAYLP